MHQHDSGQWEELQKRQSLLNKADPDRQFMGGKVFQVHPTHNSFFMKDDGISLDKFVDRSMTKRSSALKQVLSNGFQRLVEALVVLDANQLIHGDIKSANIVISPVTMKMKFIDFDFLGTLKDYRKFEKTSEFFPFVDKSTFYFAWPFERWHDPSTHSFLWDKRHTRFDHLVEIGLFQNSQSANHCKYILEHITSFKACPADTQWSPLEKRIITTYIHHPEIQEDPMKIDIYSLGLVILELLPECKIFKSMIDPLPHRRVSPHECLKQWPN
jgi:serine/threonine protein kinase